MKKVYFMVALSAMGLGMAVGVGAWNNVESPSSNIVLANVEALAESETPTIPCTKETDRTCYYLVKDADGNSVSANTPGYRHV